jgi:hypothetical protein
MNVLHLLFFAFLNADVAVPYISQPTFLPWQRHASRRHANELCHVRGAIDSCKTKTVINSDK